MKKILFGLCSLLLFALASCATYVANPPYSPDSQLQGRSFEVVGEVEPIRLDRLMLAKGLKSVILEKAKKQFGNVDDVINIRSATKRGTTFLFLFPLPGDTVYEATAIRYTD